MNTQTTIPIINYTDVIFLTHEQFIKLYSVWGKTIDSEPPEPMIQDIPSDLFIAETIPLKNFIVNGDNGACDLWGCDLLRIKCPVRIRYALIDFIPEEADADRCVCESFNQSLVGHIRLAIFIEFLEGEFKNQTLSWGLMEYGDRMISTNYYLTTENEFRKMDSFEVGVYFKEMNPFFQLYAEYIWYSIQIALLHPTVKEVFQHPTKKKERIPKSERKKNNNRVIRYVKHHIINTAELSKAIYGDTEKPYHRHALIWYVTGHWREYKSGKRVFVQPYWKGALRETKKADIRKREIVI